MLKIKSICALISTIICQCIVASMFFYISFIPYRFSQIHTKSPTTKQSSMIYITPLALCFYCAIRIVGLYLSEKLGPRIITGFGEFLILIAIFLLWVSKSLVGDYFIMIIYGIGAGFMYFPSQINLINYYSSSKLKIILRTSFGLCGIALSSVFSILLNIMVNPNGEKPTIKENDTEKVYSETVIKNIKFYLLIYLAIIGGLSILSIILMFPASQEDIEAEIQNENIIPQDEQVKEKNVDDDDQINEKITKRPRKLSENEKNYENMPEYGNREDFDDTRSLQRTRQTALLSAVTSCKMFFYIFLLLCLSLYPTTALLTFRYLGSKKNIHDTLLSWALFVFLLVWGISCPLWAIVYKHVKYVYGIYVICVLQLLLGASIYYSAEMSVAFLIVIGMSGLGMGFIHQIYPIHLQSIFGLENGIFCFGYATVALPIGGLLGVWAFSYIENAMNGKYIVYMYGITALVNLLVALMSSISKEKKFKYEDIY